MSFKKIIHADHSGDMDKFWEEAHADNKQYELTGASPKAILKFLNISEDILSNTRSCLVIGVGFGHETRYLAGLGINVSVLDISKNALQRVQDITLYQYLPNQLRLMHNNSFDLIISHLVTQHMSNKDLENQVRHCIRALKPEGIFAMQFASKRKDDVGGVIDIKATLQKQKDGLVSRSLPYMEKITADSGGKLTWRSFPIYFPHLKHSWVGIHIKRSTATSEKASVLSKYIWFWGLLASYLAVMLGRIYNKIVNVFRKKS